MTIGEDSPSKIYDQPVWLDGLQSTNPGIQKRAFEDFIRTWQQPLYFYMRRLLRNHADADDATQEVIIQVYQSISTFQRKSKFSTWLMSIAYRKGIDAIRKIKARPWVSLEEIFQHACDQLHADPLFDANEAEVKLQAAIETLPPRQRQVFVMRYFDERPFAEIVSITGKSEGALKASFHHAQKKIHAYLRRAD